MTVLLANPAYYLNAQYQFEKFSKPARIKWAAETLLMYKVAFLMLSLLLCSRMLFSPKLSFEHHGIVMASTAQ